MRLRLDLSYDGSSFRGWATQPGLRTVQGEIESALATILRLPAAPQLTCAGRTDAGVHARGQVAHVDLDDVDPPTLERRLRRLLPADIALRGLSVAPEGFDARFAALERRYVYRICDAPAVPDPLVRLTQVAWPRPLDVDAMNAAAAHLLGEHDFASFCKKREGATTIRTLLELSTVRVGNVLETTVRADAFCHSMVRALMGALVAVGEGRFAPAWAGEVLSAATRNARVTVMPAHGLVLEEVSYPDDSGLAARAEQSRQRRDVAAGPKMRQS
ncbi:tRNA pseudouridine(38-40) synthase TruA [Aeromicrobium sp. UC242_57]|uniref:tRNA pseudouridine(38-40) synthase TruA n=1 Tax=Aeromicrobium sp. UC242_57 TaxID=3374624 RepID=UPI003797CA40